MFCNIYKIFINKEDSLMKIFKRTVSLFLAFCLCAGMLYCSRSQRYPQPSGTNRPPLYFACPVILSTVLQSMSICQKPKYVISKHQTSSKNLIAKTLLYYQFRRYIHGYLCVYRPLCQKPVNTKSPIISAINQETNFLRVK